MLLGRWYLVGWSVPHDPRHLFCPLLFLGMDNPSDAIFKNVVHFVEKIGCFVEVSGIFLFQKNQEMLVLSGDGRKMFEGVLAVGSHLFRVGVAQGKTFDEGGCFRFPGIDSFDDVFLVFGRRELGQFVWDVILILSHDIP